MPRTSCDQGHEAKLLAVRRQLRLAAIDLQTRYNLTGSLGKGSGTIVALIELGDLPSAQTDLATYRSTFGLGTANSQNITSKENNPATLRAAQDFGWCVETDLDIQMVSASCPLCTIYLIEGGNCGGVVCGLEGAEATAVALGATILSNSWGCSSFNYGENCGDPNFPNYFNTPGIAYLASSGDSRISGDRVAGRACKRARSRRHAVGEVQRFDLHRNGLGRRRSGLRDHYHQAIVAARPGLHRQHDLGHFRPGGLSAQALPSTSATYGGWTDVCGTSVAAPLTAGIVALAGNESKPPPAAKRSGILTGEQHRRSCTQSLPAATVVAATISARPAYQRRWRLQDVQRSGWMGNSKRYQGVLI